MNNFFKRNGIIAIRLFAIVFFLTLACVNNHDCLAKNLQDKSMDCHQDIAKTLVHATASGLGELLKDVKSEAKRIDLIRAFIGPIRFYSDQSGYFYAYDFTCVNIAHGTQKELQGKNLFNHRDAKGKYVIRELRAAAKQGGGFVDFYWIKPGSKGEQKKRGYVEQIPGTNYFIGTGVYLP